MESAPTSSDLNTRHGRLNSLGKVLGASRYLEIGVASGYTFFNVAAPFKVAVDPRFRFDYKSSESSTCRFHEVTSDSFFREYAGVYQSFDLIYLDGLHTFEQTFRDFCSTLAFSHERTVWLIDDTHPVSLSSSVPSQRVSRLLKTETQERSGAWMGDVYKVVFAIHDFFPQFTYWTFSGHGQTVVYKQQRYDFEPKWNSLEAISRATYSDFLVHKNEIMRVCNPSGILEAVEENARLNKNYSRASRDT